VIVEYSGGCVLPTAKIYKQVYITVQKFKDGKMILFREFWNPMEVVESFGADLHTAFA
jgi:ketosteroid isomerase-like protein